MHTARYCILVEIAQRRAEGYTDLPPKLFQEYEDAYHEILAVQSGQIDIGKMSEHAREVYSVAIAETIPYESTYRLIERLYDEYREHIISNKKPENREQLEDILVELESINPVPEKSNSELLDEIYKERCEGRLRGVSTGVELLEKCTLGFKQGHVWVIGGFTGTGKSMFMNDLVLNTAKDHRTVIYSLEMTRKDLLDRMLTETERRTKDAGLAEDMVKSLKLDIVSNKTTLDSILVDILLRKQKPEIVWIDFIQNVHTKDKNEYERMTNIANRLSAFAREQNICIVELSQLSNESAGGSTFYAGYKGSGAIEADCSVGIVLQRDKEETTDHVNFNIWVKKSRYARPGKYPCQFDKENGRILYHNS